MTSIFMRISRHCHCLKSSLLHPTQGAFLATVSVIFLLFSACSDHHLTTTATLHKGQYTYKGQVDKGQYQGYGILTFKDSVVYCGQWKNGKRQGYGWIIDPEGRKINGVWNEDTIVSGTFTDSLGTYKGELDSLYRPHGHGIFIGTDGSYYNGDWSKGKRNHFGCGLTAKNKLKVGDWRNDTYRGERVTYTAERIYGIDISRYQHGKGRKTYPINWSRVRISHLGTISRKRVNGTVNYKISFCYIKSTEGKSLRNKFYLSDYRQAKAHGIHCGAYHFFSTISPAAQQARFFLANSKFQRGDFPPVLDVEPTSKQIHAMGGTNVLFARIRTWLRIVQQHTGVRPILYVGQSFVNRYLPLAPDIKRDYMIWIARYGEYKPDVRLIYWQLCPDGRVSGIRGEVDINVFNGYSDQYQQFIQNETIQ